MSEVLRPMRLSVEKDLSGGVRVGFGETFGLLTPEQAFEFAMVLMKAAGVSVDLPSAASQKHFRAG